MDFQEQDGLKQAGGSPRRILHVVGARPNFMKIAPLVREMNRFSRRFHQVLVHTGQHYDRDMSKVFFEELNLPKPDIDLEVGSDSQARQTARIMLAFEQVVAEQRPDLVIVVGDVNSTIACALTSVKLGVDVAHIEAGLRSFDLSMPEEINRRLTDQISRFLFKTEPSANRNLRKENIPPDRIFHVGNIMIDSLVHFLPRIKGRLSAKRPLFHRSPGGREAPPYVLATFHRPVNVDKTAVLEEIMRGLARVAELAPVIFPMHPRTRSTYRKLAEPAAKNIQVTPPLGYLDFLSLMRDASLVLTDSGGIQEETTWLGIPCLTVRPNTERPVTITAGTNRLVAADGESIAAAALSVLNNPEPALKHRRPKYWDGRTAERIVRILDGLL
jgi:UDP-N-acetylglucosamine 2-epimerase (non-hydrolysing)